MRHVNELLAGTVGWVLVVVGNRVGERLLFSNAKSLRPITLLEAATVSAITLVVLMAVGAMRKNPFVIATKLFAVTTVLCILQWLWLFKISPWWIADEVRVGFAARHPFAMLLIEIGLPALAGAIGWMILIRGITTGRRIAMVVASFVGCAVAAWIISPEVIRGTFELAGWLALASPRHLSGAHTDPVPRNFAYIVVAAVTGLMFYVSALRARA